VILFGSDESAPYEKECHMKNPGNNWKKALFISGACISMFSACATMPSTVVIERSDDLAKRPDWVSLSNSHTEKDGKYFFLGQVEVDGDSSKSAALNMSDEKSMSEPMRALTDQFLDQNQVGENLRKSDGVGQRIISVTRGFRPPMPGLKVVKRYWETVRTPNQNDPNETRVELRAYSLAELPKADFEQAKKAYFDRLTKSSEMKRLLDDIGAKQREAVMGTNKPENSDNSGGT